MFISLFYFQVIQYFESHLQQEFSTLSPTNKNSILWVSLTTKIQYFESYSQQEFSTLSLTHKNSILWVSLTTRIQYFESHSQQEFNISQQDFNTLSLTHSKNSILWISLTTRIQYFESHSQQDFSFSVLLQLAGETFPTDNTLSLAYLLALQNVSVSEPLHDKTTKITFALSKNSDQPGHPPSQSLRCRHEETLGP